MSRYETEKRPVKVYFNTGAGKRVFFKAIKTVRKTKKEVRGDNTDSPSHQPETPKCSCCYGCQHHD